MPGGNWLLWPGPDESGYMPNPVPDPLPTYNITEWVILSAYTLANGIPAGLVFVSGPNPHPVYPGYYNAEIFLPYTIEITETGSEASPVGCGLNYVELPQGTNIVESENDVYRDGLQGVYVV